MVWQVSQETCSTRMGQRGTFSLPGGSKYFSTGNKTQLLLTTVEHVNYPPPQERDMESSSHTAKLSQCFFLWGEAHTREAFFHLFKYIKKCFYNVVLISTIQCKSAIITHPPSPSPPGHQSANFSPAIHLVYMLLLLSPFIPRSPSLPPRPQVHSLVAASSFLPCK